MKSSWNAEIIVKNDVIHSNAAGKILTFSRFFDRIICRKAAAAVFGNLVFVLKLHSRGDEGGGSYGIFDVFSGNQSDGRMLFFSVHGFSSLREVKKEDRKSVV